jgi:hypothetical protein
MGMYTQFEATIRIPVNENTKDLLNYFSVSEFDIPYNSHEFFGCQRYTWLLSGSKLVVEECHYYTNDDVRILKLEADLKNYSNEISKFCDFISEFTEDVVIGRSLYEGFENYTYHFNSRANIKETIDFEEKL